MFGWFWKRIRKIGVFGVEVEFHPPVSGNTSKTNGEKITIADKERIPAAGSLEEQVRAHHDVQRLLNNRSWKATAEAAILELVRGEHCGDATRRSTATWSQVKAIVDELRRQ